MSVSSIDRIGMACGGFAAGLRRAGDISRQRRAEPALVSAGPWQGLDATASAERKPIRGSGAVPAAGVRGTQPPVEGQGGFAEPGLGMGEVGFCWTNQSYKRSSGVIMDL